MKKNSKLHGVIVMVHTPFNDDFSIDYSGLRNVVRGLCDDGVQGLMVCGTGGEFGSLTIEERKKIAEVVIVEVGNRVPIIVHVGHSNMSEVHYLAEHAQKTGAPAVMCLPPYLLSPPQEDIYRYFAEIAKRLDIDVMIYNNPGRTGITIDPATIIRLAKGEGIRYLKDSARNLRHTSDIIQGVGDAMVVLSGEADLFLPILALGAKGGITVPSLIVPRKVIEMYNAAIEGNMEQARKIHYQVMELIHVLGSEGKFHSAMKAALRIQGRPAGRMRPPISDVSENCKNRLREVLMKLGAL
jgi:4-hydroxy-tetrahydrodipicolinate synthase